MYSKYKLTHLSQTSGWGAKIEPEVLSNILDKLPVFNDKNLIVGFENNDDAAVYKFGDDLGIISTLDFFTPIHNLLTRGAYAQIELETVLFKQVGKMIKIDIVN